MSLQVILADLDAILALVHHAITKLALARTSPPSTTAPLLRDLTQYTANITHCTALLRDPLHGVTLVKHVTRRVDEILDALRALVQNPASGQDCLLKTGTLHDLISNARSNMPKDNQSAVYAAWKADRDSLDDNLRELADLIKDAQNDALQDDGWDEIGLGHHTSLDKAELARAKSVHQLLRLTTLLHKRIFLDLLAHPSPAPIAAFDSLLALSDRLLSTSDDLVSALYSPQDTDHVCNQILDLSGIITSFRSQLAAFFAVADDLSVQLNVLSIQDGNTAATATKKRADKKWFDTCLVQILRLCTTLNEPSATSGGAKDSTRHPVISP